MEIAGVWIVSALGLEPTYSVAEAGELSEGRTNTGVPDRLPADLLDPALRAAPGESGPVVIGGGRCMQVRCLLQTSWSVRASPPLLRDESLTGERPLRSDVLD